MTRRKGPGKAYREGITLLELAEIFPTEASAVRWFERAVWGDAADTAAHWIPAGPRVENRSPTSVVTVINTSASAPAR